MYITNNETLNLHNNTGDGMIATVVIGEPKTFTPFASVCKKPSSTLFPASLPDRYFIIMRCMYISTNTKTSKEKEKHL